MENWKLKSSAYSSKRKEKLFFYVLIEDINSIHKHFKHNFINCYCEITENKVNIKTMLFNNDIKTIDSIKLNSGQINIINQEAKKQYNKYFKNK